MRKRKSILKPLAVIFVVMFLLNMAVMRICFNINVIGATVRQEVIHANIARSLLLTAEDEADEKIEVEHIASSFGSPNSSSAGQDTTSSSPETKSTGPNTKSASLDNASVGQDTTSTGLDTMPASPDTEASLYAMSPDTVAALQQLSRTDKFVALSILSKMGRDEINRIFEISKDGITFDEYEELRVLAENRLKSSDMEALKEILSKNQGLLAQNSGE